MLVGARAVLGIGRCRLPLHALLHPYDPALLGAVLSQRPLGRVLLQRKPFLGGERLQLLRCSASLSVLLLRLATCGDSRGCAAVQPKILARVMKHFLSGIARRFGAMPGLM